MCTDTVTVIADRNIVDAFQEPELVLEPPEFRQKNFYPQIEKVKDFQDRIAELPPTVQQHELGKMLLLGLSDNKVGLYSNFHDNAVYSRGYDDPVTIRLAFM